MYVGVDYHKRYSFATKMDERDQIIEQIKLNNDPETLRAYAATLPPGSKIALEATEGWYYFYEMLESYCPEIYLAHPLKTRAIAEARIKTDKIDSTILAHLLRANLLPTSYIPPREIRDIREILRYRASLVSLRTSIKNKVHAILSKNGVVRTYTDVFGKKALRSLDLLPLRTCYQQELQGYLQCIETLKRLILEVGVTIKRLAEDSAQARLLMTIPGISYYSSLLIFSEIGDIGRFPSAKKLCSYAGLVPRVHSSGGKTRYGSITKQGSKWLRWILVELSYHFIQGSPRLKHLYARITKSHGRNTARVAVAREMLKIMYVMLRDNRAFVIQ